MQKINSKTTIHLQLRAQMSITHTLHSDTKTITTLLSSSSAATSIIAHFKYMNIL